MSATVALNNHGGPQPVIQMASRRGDEGGDLASETHE